MAQQLVLKIAGLYTNPNQLSSVPDGALVTGNNIRLNTDNLAESRRGFDYIIGEFPGGGDRAGKYLTYKNTLLAHYNNLTLAYYSSPSWMDYGSTISSPDSPLFKVRGVQANNNLYLTTSDGVLKKDDVVSDPTLSGVPQGLDISAVLTSPAAGTWFADDNAVAYRIVWSLKDLNNNVVRGAPSQRFVIANTSGSDKAVELTFTVPEGITTSHKYEVYRSAQSGGAAIEPSEELQLVYSDFYVSGDTVTIDDVTDDTLRGASLYTNPSQEGILQSNDRPPFSKDIEVFRNSTFYANTKLAAVFNLTILAVGPTDGVQIGDVVTIAGVDYTASAAENASLSEFEVVTGGTPAQNIADTAQSLIRVINRSPATTDIYAYYLSGANDLPGKILLKGRSNATMNFMVQVDAHGSAYSPNISSAQNSTQSIDKNALYFSKTNQPEAVPAVNVFFVGSAAAQILRIVALRDTLFILKEDGIYRLSGSDPTSFSVQLLDPNTRLIAPETAVTLGNFVFALTDQGVVKISDTGVSIVSRDIEDKLLRIFGSFIDDVRQKSFAVSYETDRTYHLWTVNEEGGSQPGVSFVYNYITESWTIDPLAKSAGLVGTFLGNGGEQLTDRMVVGSASSNRTSFERKAYNNTDFADEPIDVEIVSFVDSDVVLVDASEVVVGDLLFQSSSENAVITAINGNTVTTNIEIVWTPGDAQILPAIPIEIQWVPITGGNPGRLKHYRDVSLLFKERRFVISSLFFKSEIVNQATEVPITGVFGYGFALAPFGEGVWGGEVPLPIPIRFIVPGPQQRCSQLTLTYTQRSAYSVLKLEGISLWYNEHKEYLRR